MAQLSQKKHRKLSAREVKYDCTIIVVEKYSCSTFFIFCGILEVVPLVCTSRKSSITSHKIHTGTELHFRLPMIKLKTEKQLEPD